jgi:hypothetical protein
LREASCPNPVCTSIPSSPSERLPAPSLQVARSAIIRRCSPASNRDGPVSICGVLNVLLVVIRKRLSPNQMTRKSAQRNTLSQRAVEGVAQVEGTGERGGATGARGGLGPLKESRTLRSQRYHQPSRYRHAKRRLRCARCLQASEQNRDVDRCGW